MATITLRIDDDLFNKIEKRRGDKTKSEYYRDVLEYYLSQDDISNTSILQKQIEYLQGENTKLLELLAREQALNLTSQQKLLTDLNTKKWYQFWK